MSRADRISRLFLSYRRKIYHILFFFGHLRKDGSTADRCPGQFGGVRFASAGGLWKEEGEMKKEKKLEKEWRADLKRQAKNGVALYIDDTPSSPKEIGKLLAREEACYMPDYVSDDAGNLIQIRFDCVSLS